MTKCEAAIELADAYLADRDMMKAYPFGEWVGRSAAKKRRDARRRFVRAVNRYQIVKEVRM